MKAESAPFYDAASALTFCHTAQAYYYHQAIIIERYSCPKTTQGVKQSLYFSLGSCSVKAWILDGAHSPATLRHIVAQFAMEAESAALEDWEMHISALLERLSYLKFSQDKDERDWLLSTSSTVPVEASPERFLGIGYYVRDAEEHRAQWVQNMHGQALMAVRERLAQELRD